jgi:hypothetical protein
MAGMLFPKLCAGMFEVICVQGLYYCNITISKAAYSAEIARQLKQKKLRGTSPGSSTLFKRFEKPFELDIPYNTFGTLF